MAIPPGRAAAACHLPPSPLLTPASSSRNLISLDGAPPRLTAGSSGGQHSTKGKRTILMTRAQSNLFALQISAILALGLSCSAREATQPPKTDPPSYRYHHVETTGLTDELFLADGTQQPILFARESSQAELNALSAILGCGIFGTRRREPKSDDDAFEQRLFLVGELRHNVLRTPDGPGRATPEDYREFVLRTWYLEAPFSVPVGFATGELESLGHAVQSTSIRRACPTITAHGDLDRFVRVRMK